MCFRGLQVHCCRHMCHFICLNETVKKKIEIIFNLTGQFVSNDGNDNPFFWRIFFLSYRNPLVPSHLDKVSLYIFYCCIIYFRYPTSAKEGTNICKCVLMANNHTRNTNTSLTVPPSLCLPHCAILTVPSLVLTLCSCCYGPTHHKHPGTLRQWTTSPSRHGGLRDHQQRPPAV